MRLVRRQRENLSAPPRAAVTTTEEKVAVATMVGGGLLLIAGAIFYSRAAQRRTRAIASALGEVQSRVKAGNMLLTHHYDPEMPIQQRVGMLQDLVWKGVQNPQMRELALAITGNGEHTVTVGKKTFQVRGRSCPARDGLCEAEAIYDWVKGNIRYTGDVAAVKMGRDGPIEGIDLFQGGWRTAEFGGGDCLPAGTLLLTEAYEFVPIEKLVVGAKIWGRDAWTTVKDVWFKGVLPTDVVYLNNGSSFKATPDHKIYVALCKHHPVQNELPCSCPMSARSIERIALATAEPGMAVVTPDRVARLARSERYIIDHGGLGENPIWRLGVRDYDRSVLCIKAIERNVMALPVYDITTEDHYVYLPEADVTVSNCDDHSVLAATLLALNGIPARFRITAPTKSSDWAHIYPLAGLSKTRPTKWIALDTTLPGKMFSREAPNGRKVDFVA